MTCHICGRDKVFHGSELPNGRPGTYLSEAGCHNGCFMDDDKYAEGWAPDVICPPCPHNPKRCKECDGTGHAKDDDPDSDDCRACDGNGWEGGKCEWPDERYEVSPEEWERRLAVTNQ